MVASTSGSWSSNIELDESSPFVTSYTNLTGTGSSIDVIFGNVPHTNFVEVVPPPVASKLGSLKQ
jgi:hypothetical protein